MGNVAQLVTIKIFGSPFFFEQKICWNPYFYSVFWQAAFAKNKRGPVSNY